ncbi:type II toxin-antitoxin system VapC family toxin [Brucellaceae bacterium D45D]
MTTYMLDTNICSFIMRERPESVLIRLEQAVKSRARIVVSAITYSEMRYGAASPKALPKIDLLVDNFVERLDAILPWDAAAVDMTVRIRKELARIGKPIGQNDTAIAGHSISANCILVTNKTREFERACPMGLTLEDWREA